MNLIQTATWDGGVNGLKGSVMNIPSAAFSFSGFSHRSLQKAGPKAIFFIWCTQQLDDNFQLTAYSQLQAEAICHCLLQLLQFPWMLSCHEVGLEETKAPSRTRQFFGSKPRIKMMLNKQNKHVQMIQLLIRCIVVRCVISSLPC